MPAEVVRCLLCRIRLLGWSIYGKSFPSCLNHGRQGSHMWGGVPMLVLTQLFSIEKSLSEPPTAFGASATWQLDCIPSDRWVCDRTGGSVSRARNLGELSGLLTRAPPSIIQERSSRGKGILQREGLRMRLFRSHAPPILIVQHGCKACPSVTACARRYR